jgi:hypothetical protein
MGLVRTLYKFEASMDKAFRSVAVHMLLQASDKAGNGCLGIARRVKTVCASF